MASYVSYDNLPQKNNPPFLDHLYGVMRLVAQVNSRLKKIEGTTCTPFQRVPPQIDQSNIPWIQPQSLITPYLRPLMEIPVHLPNHLRQ